MKDKSEHFPEVDGRSRGVHLRLQVLLHPALAQ